MIHVDEKEFAWREGLTVAALLKELKGTKTFAVVRMDGKYITRPKFDQTVIPDGARILLIPMIAGG